MGLYTGAGPIYGRRAQARRRRLGLDGWGRPAQGLRPEAAGPPGATPVVGPDPAGRRSHPSHPIRVPYRATSPPKPPRGGTTPNLQ